MKASAESRYTSPEYFIMRILTLFLLNITTLHLVSCSQASSEQPNIILFVTDDHGLDALGCYGNPVIKTPHLDRMAAEGVRFTNAYCTSASCAASRSVILTGKFGHATGSYGHVHDYHHFRTYDHVKSLPVILADNGYETARIGKYHVAPESVYRFNTILDADPRSTLEMAEACHEVLKSEKPFFLYFCPDDPHRGNPFTPEPWDAPNNFGNKEGGYPGEIIQKYDPAEVIVPSFLPDNPQCREEIAQYYQSISRIDQGLGRLQQLLKEAGKTDNTIIIYISDNGMAFPGAKTTVYEPGIKLPCIIKDPRSQYTGTVNEAMVSWADLAPTILDFAETPYDRKDFHGRSFRTVLTEKNPVDWNTVYASHNFHELTMYYPMRVIRKNNLKLIWNVAWRLEYPFASDLWASSTWQSIQRNSKKNFGNRKVADYLFRAEFELYNLKEDPDELVNLALNSEYQDQLGNMKALLKTFQKETKDPWLIIWENDAQLQGTGVNL